MSKLLYVVKGNWIGQNARVGIVSLSDRDRHGGRMENTLGLAKGVSVKINWSSGYGPGGPGIISGLGMGSSGIGSGAMYWSII